MGGYAWVTLATNDSYSLGALVLAHSLKQVGTVHQLAVMVTPGVTPVMREKLATVFNVIKEVNILDSKDEANLRLLKRPELGITFTKLHCWRLTQFEKCVFLDADTMVLANADELFDREEFSAAPDVGWPDCFNSGVFVYRPSEETYSNIIQFALDKGSFDGGDQGLLNLYFSDWAHKDISKHLPFIYNMCSTACYSYLPAFKQFGATAKIIHFIGNSKPWLQYFDSETRHVQVSADMVHLHEVVQQWWNIFCTYVHPALSPDMPTSRAPTTFHFPSFPIIGNIFHHSSGPDNSFFNIEEKSDYRNVFDPWEEYENKFDNPSCQEEHTDNVPHFETHSVDIVAHDDSAESHHDHHHHYSHSHHFVDRLEPNVITEVFHPSSSNDNYIPHNVSSNEETRFDSNISSDRHEFDFSNNHSSNHYHTEPSLQPSSPEINTSSTTIDPALECNQLARPHECEPTSSVTNESALHDHPNEVHDGSAGLAGAFARLTLGVARTAEQAMLEDQLRRQGWEVGNIDYMGRDSFDNIWSKICETLSVGPPAQSYASPPPEPSPAVEPVVVKQVVSEPTQQPITKDTEQKTVVEKEQSKSDADVTPPSSQIESKPAAISVTPAPQPAAPEPLLAAPAPQPVAPVPQSATSTHEPAPQPPQAVPPTTQPLQAVPPSPQPTPQAPQPAAPAPQPAAPAPQPVAPEPQTPPAVAPAPQPAPQTPPSVAPAPQPAPQTPPAVAPAPQPAPQTPPAVPPSPQPAPQAPKPAAPEPRPAAPAPQPVALAPEPAPQAPKPAAPAPKTAAPTPKPAAPAPVSQPPVHPPKPAEPAKPTPQPESAKQASPPTTPTKVVAQPESPKPVSKPAPPSEPPKSAAPPPSQPPKKQPEPPKPAPPQAAKPKKEPESPKPTPSATEQAAGQKATPQSPPPKEAAQSKPEAPSAEGPTPPPRKAASAQAAAGAKKQKGKK